MAGNSNRIQLADYLLKQSTFGKNFILNPSGFQNTSDVTVSGATVSRNTTTPLTSISDLQVGFTAASQYAEWALETIDRSMAGRNCELRADYKLTLGTGATVQAQILQGGALSVSTTLVANATSLPISLNVPCSTSTTVIRMTQTVGAVTSTLNIANLSYGAATNVGSVAQATLMGTAKVTGCAGRWATSSSSFAGLGTQTGCSYAVTGAATAPATNVAGFTFAALPPGEYRIEYEGYVLSNAASNEATYQFHDGTNATREESVVYATGGVAGAPGFSGTLTYTTAQTNITFQVRAKSPTSASCTVAGTTTYPGVFRLYRYPLASEIAYRPDQTRQYFSGYMSSGSSWATTSTSLVDGTNTGGNALTARQSSGMTVTAGASNVAGITFTPVLGFSYLISASFAARNGSAGNDYAVTLTDGTTIVSSLNAQMGVITSNPNYTNSLTGIYVPTSVSPVTLKLQIAATGGTTVIQNLAGITGSTAIEWTILGIPATNAPILVGSVTSGTLGAERIERANSGNSCVLGSQSGSWISLTSNPSTGRCNFAITGFSARPVCVFSVFSNASGDQGCFTRGGTSSTNLEVQCTQNGTDADSQFNIICMGPRT